MNDSSMTSPGLRRFSFFTAAVMFVLIWFGGLVTSHGVGMSVPDWPNSYGYNMFMWPPSQWLFKGGVHYEHSHRLLGSLLGVCALVQLAWAYGPKSRPFLKHGGVFMMVIGVVAMGWVMFSGRVAAEDRVMGKALGWGGMLAAVGLVSTWSGRIWLDGRGAVPASRSTRRLMLALFFLVLFQGVLGGMRVVYDVVGRDVAILLRVFHGVTAQLAFVLACLTALSTTAWWRRAAAESAGVSRRHGWLAAVATGVIVLQLTLGACMRHQEAGLAVPDFPKAYGAWWPDTSGEAVERYNARRMEAVALNPITANHIRVHMAHRIMAVVICGLVLAVAAMVAKRPGTARRVAFVWAGLLTLQFILGLLTVLKGKPADVATAHMAVGALSLGVGASLTAMSFGWLSSSNSGSVQGRSSGNG